jgi:hypothetical protein
VHVPVVQVYCYVTVCQICVCFVCTQSEASSFLLEADHTAAVSKYKAKFDTLHLRVANITLHAELDPDSTDVLVCKASVCARCTLLFCKLLLLCLVSRCLLCFT